MTAQWDGPPGTLDREAHPRPPPTAQTTRRSGGSGRERVNQLVETGRAAVPQTQDPSAYRLSPRPRGSPLPFLSYLVFCATALPPALNTTPACGAFRIKVAR